MLETLHALTSNTKLVKEAMAKGLCSSVDMFFFRKIRSRFSPNSEDKNIFVPQVL